MERNLLRKLRIKNKLTQQKLAEELGISAVYVRKIEKGNVNAGLPTMLKYEKFFGVSMRELFPDIFLSSCDNKVIKKRKQVG